MQKIIVFTALLIILAQPQVIDIQTKKTCTCEQLLIQADCLQKENCYWKGSNCLDPQITPPEVKVIVYPRYCDLFNEKTCSSMPSCAWVDQKCIHFTGCTAFLKTTDLDCQQISKQCYKSNGTRCIHLGECSSYGSELACTKDLNGKYCYWNQSECVVADDCQKLPKTLLTDADCRNEIIQCTTTQDGGCTQRGNICEDNLLCIILKSKYFLEIQCFNNLDLTISCFWDIDSLTCKEKTCENASLFNTTHKQCQSFLKQCTSKQNGGCVQKTSCIAVTYESACVVDIFSRDCYWTGSACVYKACDKAPLTLNTNNLCAGFQEKCITKLGGGCIDNSLCSDVSIQIACSKDINGNVCIWNDGKCWQKTCLNAPSTLKTHYACLNFLPDCTVNSTQNGCEIRSCLNAPTSYNKNTECESWLPGQNCITKLNGGCMTNTTCQKITARNGCLQNVNGEACFWNGSVCQLKVCSNAPTTYNDHSKCFQFSEDCTVNSSFNGCVPRICNNFTTEGLCQNDLNKNPCIWKARCFQKSCSNASSSFQSHTQCYEYYNQCTVNLTSNGCVDLPLTCEYLTQNQCYLTRKGSICGWTGTTCIPKDCVTAPVDLIYTYQCNQFKNGCVVSNQGLGCISLPQTCGDRKLQDNCEYGLCVWRNNACIDKTCNTAQTSGCSDYGAIQECLINSNSNGCIDKPSICDGLNQNQCNIGSILNGNCYYQVSKSQCVSLICSNLSPSEYSHDNCHTILNSCTVNNIGNGCMDLQQECSQYFSPIQCVMTLSQNCGWYNNSCRVRTCEDAPDTPNYNTNSECESFLSSCTVEPKATGQGCIEKPLQCYQLTQNQCWNTLNNGQCYFDGYSCKSITQLSNCSKIILKSYTQATCTYISTKCTGDDSSCFDKTCSNYSGTFNHQNCNNWLSTCTNNYSKTACINMPSQCINQLQESCTTSINTKCNWNTSCTNIESTTPCSALKPSSYTDDNCSFMKSTCKANIELNACYDRPSTCTLYTQSECIKSQTGSCYWDGSCYQINSNTECSSLKLSTYTVSNCSNLKTNCTTDNSACINKTCANKTTPFTQSDCSAWLTTCISNKDDTACIDIQATCNLYSEPNCFKSIESYCFWDGTNCINRTCSSSYTPLQSTHSECEAWLPTCTINRIGQCITKASSCSELKTLQCYTTISNQPCYLDGTNCINLTCGNLPAATFQTHASCYAASNLCTVDVDGSGCISTMDCIKYELQSQCYKDSQNKDCVWNIYSNPNTCQPKGCGTAPLTTSYNTHELCQAYMSNCTVLASGDGGCTPLVSCESYKSERQCKVDSTLAVCGWNGFLCALKDCNTAPSTITKFTDCQAYISGCTINHSGQGCITIPDHCNQMTLSDQCRTTALGIQCYWNEEQIPAVCQERTCDNAPASVDSASGCENHMKGCTLELIKCKDKLCEDFPYTTDDQCKSALSKCTTDGIKCIPRSTCELAVAEAGCVNDFKGIQCQWMGSYCTNKTCSTAPITYVTEYACKTYISSCTAKLSGGCIEKTSCDAATIQTACTHDRNGIMCVWDNDHCRDIDCRDYVGATHKTCNRINPLCTSNGQGACARMVLCSETQIPEACIVGLDGPCLWIKDVGCFRYDNCTSIQWSTDQQCKQISSQCTTNGHTCYPITDCSETNTQGGCITGTNGVCAMTQILIENAESLRCKIFTECSQINFSTHYDCQQANKTCTTNGESACIPLKDCTSYFNKAQCFINDKGIQYDQNGKTISTGICVWNMDKGKCIDQDCMHFKGVLDQECKSYLTKCTTNGKTCEVQKKCAEYTEQLVCQNGLGLDGLCIWDSQGCRLLLCSDIQNGDVVSNCQILETCVSDGTKCILKTSCYGYKTITACQNGGYDQICNWVDNPTAPYCALMTSCQFADANQNACQSNNLRCLWIPATTTEKSRCIDQTCTTLAEQRGYCGPLQGWDQMSIQVCGIVNGKCQKMAPNNLSSSDCYLRSNYYYAWSPKTNQCSICQVQVQGDDTQTVNQTKKGNNLQYVVTLAVFWMLL